MKKLMIAAVAVAITAVANAACINWKYSGVEADATYTLYLFSTAVSDKYDDFKTFSQNAISSGEVTTKKSGPRTYYVIDQTTATSDTLAKNSTVYFALIEGSDAKTYTYGKMSSIQGGVELVYDPQAQESSKGTLSITSSGLTSSGTIGKEEPTPEPTSAMLMLLGMAGLALRRKRA